MNGEPRSTSTIAGEQAAGKVGGWRLRILARLRESPSALWELGEHFGVPDHVISGRLTELARDLWIERTGDRRLKPASRCPADVWRVTDAAAAKPADAVVAALGYPETLVIDNELYDRQPLADPGYAAVPYARRTDQGGLRLTVQVALVECPSCGKPLKLVSGGSYHCGSPDCFRWNGAKTNEPGKAALIALVIGNG